MKHTIATGRRKTASAQVRMLPGTGKVMINNREINEYLPVEVWRVRAMRPLDVTNNHGNFDFIVKVRGGGKSGQTDAIQLGIARALVKYNEENKPILKEASLLTRDPRMVERKKYGQKKARKRFQFSKR
jgi:small subunit ribosomal protein S9